jgi:hypothetical protein
VKAGYLEEAMKVTDIIISPRWRTEGLVAIAEAAVQAGKPALALAAVGKARAVVGKVDDNDEFKSTLLENIAVILSRLGRIDDALAVARSIEEREWARNSAIAAVVGALARAGDMERARALANQVGDPKPVIRAFAEADRIDEAVALARQVADPAARAENLLAVARVLVERKPQVER